MKWSPQGLERLAMWKQKLGEIPLVGIGGLSPDRGAAALEAGADIVSAVTDITLHDNPEARVKHWLETVEKSKEHMETNK